MSTHSTTRNYQSTRTSGGSKTEVPWYEFHEFKELSSRTFRALEEQLYIKKAQLKRQSNQHAAILVPDKQVQLIKVATVREHEIRNSERDEFKEACFEEAGCYKTPVEADRELNALEQKLLSEGESIIATGAEPKVPKRRNRSARSIFATIKAPE